MPLRTRHSPNPPTPSPSANEVTRASRAGAGEANAASPGATRDGGRRASQTPVPGDAGPGSEPAWDSTGKQSSLRPRLRDTRGAGDRGLVSAAGEAGAPKPGRETAHEAFSLCRGLDSARGTGGP